MDFQLRDYQIDHNQRIAVSLKKHKHVIAQAPGGTGKTKQFTYISWSASERKKSTVIIVTHRQNVYDQNLREAKAIGINADTDKNLAITDGLVYVAMVQTLNSRPQITAQLNRLSKPVLTIIDECHDGSFNLFLREFTNRITIGFTATPHHKWAPHLKEFYSDCVCGNQIDWFIRNNWLCSYKHLERSKADLEKYLTKLNGEYTEKSQNGYFGQTGLFDGLLDDLRSSKFTKCMVFCASIENAERTYTHLTENHIKCAIGHSKRKDEQEQLNLFKSNQLVNVLVSVSSYTTGFDMPEVDQVMLYRAFGSLPLYLQTMFRANRIVPGGSKKMFTVYDYGNNKRHGLYYFDRSWDVLWKGESKRSMKGQGVEPIKECPSCHALIGLMLRVCPFCLSEQPENEQELKQGELISVTEKYDNMIGRKIGDLEPDELAIYAKLKNKGSFAIRIAKSRRQLQIEEQRTNPSDRNYLKEFGFCMGYKPRWYFGQKKLLEKSTAQILFTNFILK